MLSVSSIRLLDMPNLTYIIFFLPFFQVPFLHLLRVKPTSFMKLHGHQHPWFFDIYRRSMRREKPEIIPDVTRTLAAGDATALPCHQATEYPRHFSTRCRRSFFRTVKPARCRRSRRAAAQSLLRHLNEIMILFEQLVSLY